MEDQSLIKKIIEMEKRLEEIKSSVEIEETFSGIQVMSLHYDDLSYVHYWDDRNEFPTVLLIVKEKVDEKILIEKTCQAWNKLTPSAFDRTVEFRSNIEWERLPINFQKLKDVFQINLKEPNEYNVYQIKRSIEEK